MLVKYISSFRQPRTGDDAVNVHTCSPEIFLKRLREVPVTEAELEPFVVGPDRTAAAALLALNSKHLCEFFFEDPYVKPYYDWDKLVDSADDINRLIGPELKLFTDSLSKLHPHSSPLLGHRCGYKPDNRKHKISLRAFIPGIKMKVSHIANHIHNTLGDARPKQLDVTVYKASEQVLACLGCWKSADDPRVLQSDPVKIASLDDDTLAGYVAQDTRGCDVLAVSAAAASAPAKTSSSALIPFEDLTAPRMPLSGIERLGGWLSKEFAIDETLLRLNDPSTDRTGALIFSTRSKSCPFIRDTHKGNHLYIKVKMNAAVELRCHDTETCGGRSLNVPWSKVPPAIRAELSGMAGDVAATSPASIPEAQRVLSEGLNKALCPTQDWVWEADPASKGKEVSYKRVAPGCVRCLQFPAFEHAHTDECLLTFSATKKRRHVAIECITNTTGPLDVTARFPGLLEVHHTYNAHLRVSGGLSVKVTKEKETIQAQLIEMMFQRAYEEGIRVDATDVYKPIPGTKCCMASDGNHLDFLKRIFRNNPDYNGDPTRSEKLEKAILRGSDDRLPTIRKDKDWIGVKNGLFNIRTCQLTPYDQVSPAMEADLVARHYIDQTMDPQSPTTPLWDQLISNHVKDPHVQEVILAIVGRTLLPAGTDNHDLMLYFYGPGQRGKSTAVEVVQAMHNRADTAVIGGTSQATFVASGKDAKSLIVFPDMPENISKSIDAGTFKSMTAGDDISLNGKNQSERSVRWTVPMIGAGNIYPNWPNAQDSLSRRLAIVEFTSALSTTDGGLKRGILEAEIGNLLFRAIEAYWRILRGPAYARQSFYQSAECPAYFLDTIRRYQARVDPVRAFLLATPDQLTDRADGVTWVIRQDPMARSQWAHVLAAYAVYISNTSRSSSTQRLTPDLDLWKAINCTFKERAALIKDCPEAKYDHRCRHVNKAKSHVRTTGIAILGLSVTTVDAEDAVECDGMD
jgi:hypothetical protein